MGISLIIQKIKLILSILSIIIISLLRSFLHPNLTQLIFFQLNHKFIQNISLINNLDVLFIKI